jgi:hypothetical protein
MFVYASRSWARSDHRQFEVIAFRHAHSPAVELCAHAAARDELLVAERIENHRLLDAIAMTQRNGHRKVGNSVQEVRRAVERIDDPGVRTFSRCTGLLGDDGVIGIGAMQRFDDGVFGGAVDLRDEIVSLLLLHLQDVHPIERAHDDLSRAPCRPQGDVQHRLH